MATSSAIKLIASIFGASSICVCPVSRLIAPWMFRRWRPVVCSIPGHVLRRPTSCRPRLMRGMYRINEHDRFIGFEAVQKLLVARDESLLLRFVKLARHALRLVIDKTKPMQQCDQPRVFPKPGPNRIRAAGQPRRDK